MDEKFVKYMDIHIIEGYFGGYFGFLQEVVRNYGQKWILHTKKHINRHSICDSSTTGQRYANYGDFPPIVAISRLIMPHDENNDLGQMHL